MYRLLIVGLSLLLAFVLPKARADIVLLPETQSVPLAGHFSLLVDKGGKVSLADAIEALAAGRFRGIPGNLNRGYTESASWLTFTVRDDAAQPLNVVIHFTPYYLDQIDAYVQSGTNASYAQEYRHYAVGDHTPMAEKPLHAPSAAVPLSLKPGSAVRVFVRVQTHSAHGLRGAILSSRAFSKLSFDHVALQGAYIGIAVALAIINFLLAFRLSDSVFALYAGYLLTLAAGDLGIQGMISLCWPAQAHHLADLMTGIGTGLGFSAICLFAASLFHTARYHPRSHRFLLAVVFLGGLTFLASGTSYYGRLAGPLFISGLALAVLLPWLAFLSIRRGEDAAAGRLFLMAFGASAVGASLTFLRLVGLLPFNEITQYALQATSVIHMIIMMMGLSERVLTAEETALKAARESENVAQRLAEKMTEKLKKSQGQLAEALDTERRLREEQGRFIDTISHEYRTPLAVIKTNVDILRERQVIDDRRFGVMHGAMTRLQEIFTDALRANRLGRPPVPAFGDYDLRQLVDDTVGEGRSVCFHCGVEFDAPAEPLMVRADAGLLKTALRNVLENAGKYLFPADGPISVALRREGDTACVEVANPIDPKQPLERDNLFERFVRGGTQSGKSGMGLGLYLVRRILHDHGGTAVIADGPRDRFRIVLTLPLVEDENYAARNG